MHLLNNVLINTKSLLVVGWYVALIFIQSQLELNHTETVRLCFNNLFYYQIFLKYNLYHTGNYILVTIKHCKDL